MQHLRLVPSAPRRHFAFEARFDIPMPETPSEPTPDHLPPFHTMFSEVGQGVYGGECARWFIPLSLLEADRSAAVVGLVTPFYADAVVRDAFGTWQGLRPGDREGIALAISHLTTDEQEPGMFVSLDGGACDVR